MIVNQTKSVVAWPRIDGQMLRDDWYTMAMKAPNSAVSISAAGPVRPVHKCEQQRRHDDVAGLPRRGVSARD